MYCCHRICNKYAITITPNSIPNTFLLHILYSCCSHFDKARFGWFTGAKHHIQTVDRINIIPFTISYFSINGAIISNAINNVNTDPVRHPQKLFAWKPPVVCLIANTKQNNICYYLFQHNCQPIYRIFFVLFTQNIFANKIFYKFNYHSQVLLVFHVP